MCACVASSAPLSRLTRRSPNTFPKTVRNDVPAVFGMCRNNTGFARYSLSASTRFGESLVAKDLEFIAAHLLFYSQNSMTTRACYPSTFATQGGDDLTRLCSHDASTKERGSSLAIRSTWRS